MVSVDDSVVAIGGVDKNTGQDSANIFKLECNQEQECGWYKLSETLEVARYYFVAMMIPDHLTNCTNQSNHKIRKKL